eukprot:scaffold2353_cov93-Skeletonema_dohrnii-CCMP3373.AAC.5
MTEKCFNNGKTNVVPIPTLNPTAFEHRAPLHRSHSHNLFSAADTKHEGNDTYTSHYFFAAHTTTTTHLIVVQVVK